MTTPSAVLAPRPEATAAVADLTSRAVDTQCRRAFVRSEPVQPRRGVEGGHEAAAQPAVLRPQ